MTGGLTWEEAVAILGCDKRTLQRLARAGKIGSERVDGFSTLYDRADVEMMGQARREAVRTGVLAPASTPNGNGHGAIAHQRHEPTPIEALLVQVLEALRAALAVGATGATEGVTGATGVTGPTPDDWMTVAAIARAWRWPRRVVLVLLYEGNFGKPVDIGTPGHPRLVVRRAAVEAFAKGREP